jgi:hypothetical protein
MALKPLQYTIPDTTRVPWTATQEKSISHEFPLNVKDESCDDFIARTYFQFLWLPEVSWSLVTVWSHPFAFPSQ